MGVSHGSEVFCQNSGKTHTGNKQLQCSRCRKSLNITNKQKNVIEDTAAAAVLIGGVALSQRSLIMLEATYATSLRSNFWIHELSLLVRGIVQVGSAHVSLTIIGDEGEKRGTVAD
ncbi:hypothetical protein JOB18_035427 [Solea senegalensis]|uniref:Uncharacterized protein n=1 Tax=Solea senegalensis TaxID=28829 RepID=A0AAV6QGP8_SOLSE|nr:hypothetical protein JOB18_035427 [Solea senegalensis]